MAVAGFEALKVFTKCTFPLKLTIFDFIHAHLVEKE